MHSSHWFKCCCCGASPVDRPQRLDSLIGGPSIPIPEGRLAKEQTEILTPEKWVTLASNTEPPPPPPQAIQGPKSSLKELIDAEYAKARILVEMGRGGFGAARKLREVVKEIESARDHEALKMAFYSLQGLVVYLRIP